MKAYVFYTKSISDCFELIKKSSKEIEDLEIIPILGGTEQTKDLAGSTGSRDYMKLMLTRWLTLPNIIRDNMGNNILFIDSYK